MPYAQVMDKLVEHYGIVVSESTVRHITHLHAQKMHQKTKGGPQGLPNKVAPRAPSSLKSTAVWCPSSAAMPAKQTSEKAKNYSGKKQD